jgi:hypothetical protein
MKKMSPQGQILHLIRLNKLLANCTTNIQSFDRFHAKTGVDKLWTLLQSTDYQRIIFCQK